jgi:hypothetical protein
LNVAASPDIAPVLDDVARRFNASKPKISDFCAEVRVSPQLSSEVASSLVDAGEGGGVKFDVWVPDSSIWPEQARVSAGERAVVPDRYTSIASSPTVIAMPGPVANQISGSGGVGWRRLLQVLDSEQPLQLGFPDPTVNTTGLAALLSVGKIIGDTPQARAQQVAVMRSITNAGAVGRSMQDVFAKLPKTQDSAAIASSVAAVPTTEQSVWKYNTDRPAVPLVAVYPTEGALRLDYPYVVTLNSPDSKRQKAADRFLKELQKSAGRKELQDNGFRAPDGTAGAALNPQAGVNPQAPEPADKPDPATVSTVIKSWRVINLPIRQLVLMDISGSMSQPVPGVNKTRMEVTLTAAQQGLGLLQDTSELGVWLFSSGLDGKKDYRQVIPIGPLSAPLGDLTRRGAVANALTTLQPKPGGATGLYDSILAAYKVIKAGYKPNRVNSVLVFTDGKNEDPTGGISLDALVAELKKEFDPNRPVPVFIMAFGPDTDIASSRKIADATTGAAYQANTPGEITKVFLDAVGQRQCRPNCG